ncbi:hypothetical protein ACLB2K_050662 [Fragaria x ananassa]
MCLERAHVFLKHKGEDYDFDNTFGVLRSICRVKVLILSEDTTKALLREGSMHAQFDHISYLSMHMRSLTDELVPAMVSLLKGMPNLNTLHLKAHHSLNIRKPKACGFKRKYWKSQNREFIHQLKEVSIDLSNGYTYNALELTRCILEHAQNLKKMVIFYLPRQSYVIGRVNKSNKVSTATVVVQESRGGGFFFFPSLPLLRRPRRLCLRVPEQLHSTSDAKLAGRRRRCRREEEEEVSRAEKRRRRRSCRREEEEKEAALLGGGGGAAAKEEEEAPRRGGVGVAVEKRRSGSCRREEEEEEAALLGGGGGAAAKEEEEAPLWWGSNQTRERESNRRAREREMKRMRERELKVIEWNRKKFQNFWRDHCRLKFLNLVDGIYFSVA